MLSLKVIKGRWRRVMGEHLLFFCRVVSKRNGFISIATQLCVNKVTFILCDEQMQTTETSTRVKKK